MFESFNCCFSVVQESLVFRESDRHQFLPIYHSRAMTEPVFCDAVVVIVTSCISVVVLLSLVSMLDISCAVSI